MSHFVVLGKKLINKIRAGIIMLSFQINQTNFMGKQMEDIAFVDVNVFFAQFKEKMEKVGIKEDLLDFIKRKTRI